MMGTWKLNEAKSKFSAGSAKNKTVVYSSAFFKTKDYAVTGDPTSDMRAYTKVDEHTLSMTFKKGGKVTGTGRVVVSADGKSRTVTTNGTNAKGKKFTNVAVYDKQ